MGPVFFLQFILGWTRIPCGWARVAIILPNRIPVFVPVILEHTLNIS